MQNPARRNKVVLVAESDDFPDSPGRAHHHESVLDNLKKEIKPIEGKEKLDSIIMSLWDTVDLAVSRKYEPQKEDPDVILALRLAPKKRLNDLTAWYIEEFHDWRGRAPAAPVVESSVGKKPRLENPFRRGFNFVLGEYDGCRFSLRKDLEAADIAAGKPAEKMATNDGPPLVDDWTLLRHYASYEEARLKFETPRSSRYLLITEMVKSHLKKGPRPAHRSALSAVKKAPDNVSTDLIFTVCLDDRLKGFTEVNALLPLKNAIRDDDLPEEEAIVYADNRFYHLMKLDAKALGTEDDLLIKIRFFSQKNLTMHTFREACEKGWVCVFYEDSRSAVSQVRNKTLSGRRDNTRPILGDIFQPPPPASAQSGRSDAIWVQIKKTLATGMEIDLPYLNVSNNFFVFWDCLWEAVFMSLQGRKQSRGRTAPGSGFASGAERKETSQPAGEGPQHPGSISRSPETTEPIAASNAPGPVIFPSRETTEPIATAKAPGPA